LPDKDVWKFYVVVFVPLIAAIGLEISKPAIAYYTRYTLMARGIDVGLIMTGLMLGRAIGSFISGKVADRVKQAEHISLIGMVLAVIVTISYIWADNVIAIIALRALHGLLGGLVWSSLQSSVGKKTAFERRSSVMGIYFLGGGIGMALGNGIYTVLNPSYTHALLLAALFYASSIVPLAMFSMYPQVTYAQETVEGSNKKTLPLLLLLISSALTVGYIVGSIGEVFIVYLKEVYSLERTGVTSILFYAQLMGVFLGLILSRLADRFGEHKVIAMGSIIAALSGWALAFRLPIIFLILASASFVAIYRGLLPVVRGLATKTGSKVGESVGLSNMASSIGAMFSPAVVGLFYDRFGIGQGNFILGGLGFSIVTIPVIINILLSLYLESSQG
jgi:MFS family permease